MLVEEEDIVRAGKCGRREQSNGAEIFWRKGGERHMKGNHERREKQTGRQMHVGRATEWKWDVRKKEKRRKMDQRGPRQPSKLSNNAYREAGLWWDFENLIVSYSHSAFWFQRFHLPHPIFLSHPKFSLASHLRFISYYSLWSAFCCYCILLSVQDAAHSFFHVPMQQQIQWLQVPHLPIALVKLNLQWPLSRLGLHHRAIIWRGQTRRKARDKVQPDMGRQVMKKAAFEKEVCYLLIGMAFYPLLCPHIHTKALHPHPVKWVVWPNQDGGCVLRGRKWEGEGHILHFTPATMQFFQVWQTQEILGTNSHELVQTSWVPSL